MGTGDDMVGRCARDALCLDDPSDEPAVAHLQLSEGEATAQVRYVSATGNADGTVRQIIQITGIDLEGVIAYAD